MSASTSKLTRNHRDLDPVSLPTSGPPFFLPLFLFLPPFFLSPCPFNNYSKIKEAHDKTQPVCVAHGWGFFLRIYQFSRGS